MMLSTSAPPESPESVCSRIACSTRCLYSGFSAACKSVRDYGGVLLELFEVVGCVGCTHDSKVHSHSGRACKKDMRGDGKESAS